jgi:hypothetical protein
MSDFKASIVKTASSATKAWYPTPSANLTGTLTSRGKTIDGTGTLFLSELSAGDYLLNPTTDQLQIIERIESNILLTVKTAFTTPLSGDTCQRIKNNSIKSIQVVFTGATLGTIRGASQATGGSWAPLVRWKIERGSGIDPQLITPGGSSTACVTTEE